MFCGGLFSAKLSDRLRVDAIKLAELTTAALNDGLQAGSDNPLLGIEGRRDLLRRLGGAVLGASSIFARNDAPRPGGLFDHLASLASSGRIAAATVLTEVLQHLGPIGPGRTVLGGVPLGDCWRHPAITTGDATDQLMPLHKLSQWLTYSLIEPMERAGIAVTEIDGLTGLAEYRNGGRLIHTAAPALRDHAYTHPPHHFASPSASS